MQDLSKNLSMDQFADRQRVFKYGSWSDIIGFYVGVIAFCLITLLVLRPEIDASTQLTFVLITLCAAATGRLGSIIMQVIVFLVKKSSKRDQENL